MSGRQSAVDLRATRVYLNALPDEVYHGYTTGETWNGWVCPYFPFEEAERIARDQKEKLNEIAEEGHEYQAEYDEKRDVFRFYDPYHEHWDEFEPAEIGGRKLYPIGTYIWTWSEVDE